jgi:hypothetical protein
MTAPGWYVPEDPTPREVCPCCDYVSLPERGQYIICHVCYWEDEGIDVDELDVESGANESITLREARVNFQRYGAFLEKWAKKVCSRAERERLVRRPRNVG